MQSNTKIGKIKDFDGYTGTIVSLSGQYYFTRNDIITNTKLENNDMVMFNGKTEDKFPQAYYVKKILIKMKKSQ